jgi:hypothetical protein
VRECFTPYKPQAKSLAVVEQANEIIDEYAVQGFTLTLRQLYYQFVARDLIANRISEYRRLGRIIRDARDGGLIDWAAIEDRTREVNVHNAWDSPASIVESSVQDYQEDLWRNQVYRPEVWIEKDALLGVIEGVCTEYRVPYFAHRGNNSQTLQHEAGKRFAGFLDQGLIPLVLHLADHDPNGIDMTRDNQSRAAGTLCPCRRRGPSNRPQHGPGAPLSSAAQLRQGNRHPHRRLRQTVPHRQVLGTGRAVTDGDRRPDPCRNRPNDRLGEVVCGESLRSARAPAITGRGYTLGQGPEIADHMTSKREQHFWDIASVGVVIAALLIAAALVFATS